MKYVLLMIIFILPTSLTELFSQSLNGVLTLNPYPSPYASDWENNPTALGSLIIYNSTGKNLEIRIRAIITMQG